MIRELIRSLARDRRGVAAVEFALVAPVMIIFYLGFVEVCAGFMAQKRVSHISALVADLVAQEEAVSVENMNGIAGIAEVIMKPFPPGDLSQRVRSITLTDGVAVVDWTYTTGSADFDGGPVTLPVGLIEEGQSIIMSEAEYDFDPPVGYLPRLDTQLEARYYLRPRVVDTVLCSNCPPAT